MSRVLLADLAVDPEVYAPATHLAPHLPPGFLHWRPAEGQTPPTVRGVTHVILTGSEASIVNPPAWCAEVESLVRVATAEVMPMLGICFGHQLLARIGGGAVRRTPTPELGWAEHRLSITDPPLGLPSTFFAFTAHLDEVAAVPLGYEALASTPRCAIAVMRHRKHPFFGVQPHCEIDLEHGVEIVESFPKRFPLYAPAACAELAAPRDDGVAQAVFASFLMI